jgi:hypothetical protein
MTPWTRIPRASSSSRTTLSGICLPRFFTSRRTQRSSGREKSHTLAPEHWPTISLINFDISTSILLHNFALYMLNYIRCALLLRIVVTP